MHYGGTGGESAMSQQAVERTIGKLVTDEAFRRRFAADPPRASLEAGLALSATELSALVRISAAALDRLARTLDDSIRRLVGAEPACCGPQS
jgi:hypothetical protein